MLTCSASKLVFSHLVEHLMLEIGPREAFICTEQHKQRINADIYPVSVLRVMFEHVTLYFEVQKTVQV